MSQQTVGHRILSLKGSSRSRVHVNQQKTVKFSSGVQKDFVHCHNLYKAVMLTSQFQYLKARSRKIFVLQMP